MDKKNTSLKIFAQIKPIEQKNEEFQLCKIYLQSVGKNRNYSYMSKENIQKNLPTLSYAPVVGHLIPKYDDTGNIIGHYFGGHDCGFDENWNYKTLTVPFGVIIKDSFDFEEIEELGTKKEYVTCLCYLWVDRYPELKEAIYDENVWFSQSMELSVDTWKPYEEDSNYTELVDWTYSAACILGKSDDKEHPEWNTEPCFIESKIISVQYAIDQANFSTAMEKMKQAMIQSQIDLSFDNKVLGKEENKMSTEIRDSILKEYNIALEDINFEISNSMTEEDFRNALDNYKSNQTSNDEPKTNSFSTTYKQKREALENALDPIIVKDGDNVISETWCWIVDFDDNYAFVERHIWSQEDEQNDYGRFKYSFNEADIKATIEGEFEPIILTWLTVEENQKIEEERKDYQVLKTFKNEYDKKEHKTKINEVLSQFDDLADINEFKSILDKAYEFEKSEDLEKECFAIRGKYKIKKDGKKKTDGVIKIPLSPSIKEDEPYGGFFTKYGSK